MLKTMGSPRIINAILWNIKINRPKFENTCRYKLATYWQNFTEIHLTWVIILHKVFLGGGATFLTHTVEPELLPIEVLHCENRDFRPFLLLWLWPWHDDLHNYMNLTRILSQYTGCAKINFHTSMLSRVADSQTGPKYNTPLRRW